MIASTYTSDTIKHTRNLFVQNLFVPSTDNNYFPIYINEHCLHIVRNLLIWIWNPKTADNALSSDKKSLDERLSCNLKEKNSIRGSIRRHEPRGHAAAGNRFDARARRLGSPTLRQSIYRSSFNKYPLSAFLFILRRLSNSLNNIPVPPDPKRVTSLHKIIALHRFSSNF